MVSVKCPKCGHVFSIEYSRATMCVGCRLSVAGGCDYAVCPRCGHEFRLYGG